MCIKRRKIRNESCCPLQLLCTYCTADHANLSVLFFFSLFFFSLSIFRHPILPWDLNKYLERECKEATMRPKKGKLHDVPCQGQILSCIVLLMSNYSMIFSSSIRFVQCPYFFLSWSHYSMIFPSNVRFVPAFSCHCHIIPGFFPPVQICPCFFLSLLQYSSIFLLLHNQILL